MAVQYKPTTPPKEQCRLAKVNMLRWTKHQLDAIVADTGMSHGIAMGALVHCWAMAPEKARIAAGNMAREDWLKNRKPKKS